MSPLNAAQKILQHLCVPYATSTNNVSDPGKAKRRKANKIARQSRRINKGK